MSSPKLSEFLRQQKAEQSEAVENYIDAKKEWVDALSGLVDQVTRWLRPQADEGLLKLNRTQVTLQEERLGVYTAPALEIQVGSRVVTMLPIARLVFGGAGRVDLAHGPRVRILLRTSGQRMIREQDERLQTTGPLKWMISSTDPADHGAELTEETLSVALQSLLS